MNERCSVCREVHAGRIARAVKRVRQRYPNLPNHVSDAHLRVVALQMAQEHREGGCPRYPHKVMVPAWALEILDRARRPS